MPVDRAMEPDGAIAIAIVGIGGLFPGAEHTRAVLGQRLRMRRRHERRACWRWLIDPAAGVRPANRPGGPCLLEREGASSTGRGSMPKGSTWTERCWNGWTHSFISRSSPARQAWRDARTDRVGSPPGRGGLRQYRLADRDRLGPVARVPGPRLRGGAGRSPRRGRAGRAVERVSGRSAGGLGRPGAWAWGRGLHDRRGLRLIALRTQAGRRRAAGRTGRRHADAAVCPAPIRSTPRWVSRSFARCRREAGPLRSTSKPTGWWSARGRGCSCSSGSRTHFAKAITFTD